jgi:putative Holliday junction resolvase
MAVAQRLLGIDYGERRIGLAISDVSGTLARPLATLQVTASDPVATVLPEIARLSNEADGLGAIVVGLPTRLDGSANEQTPRVQAFIARLAARTPLPIASADERLSSREAESRLALRERDWKRRKQRVDAAAAAIMLQDYLDSHAGPSPSDPASPAEPPS